MLALERRWRRGRAMTLAGGGLLAGGFVAYCFTGQAIFDQSGPWWPWSLWPFGLMWLGALAAASGQIYLSATECPACHEELGNHLARGGILGKSFPIRFCPWCGAELLTVQGPP